MISQVRLPAADKLFCSYDDEMDNGFTPKEKQRREEEKVKKDRKKDEKKIYCANCNELVQDFILQEDML